MVISLLLICVVMFAVSASFAADENVTLGEVDDEIAIDDDVLSVEEDTDSLSVDDESSEVVSASATVTNATFHSYFDDSGSLLDTVTADELEFEGDFTGVDVNYITIGKSIKFTGKNAIFENVSFVIDANNVTINGFTFKQTSNSLFSIAGNNTILSNNVIIFNADKTSDSYVIYAGPNWAGAIDGLTVINNNITYVGNTSNGKNINSIIFVSGYAELFDFGDEPEFKNDVSSKNILIDNNEFNILIPSVNKKNGDWGDSYPLSSGITLYYCENATVSNNKIKLKYNMYKGSIDTINVVNCLPIVKGFTMDYDTYKLDGVFAKSKNIKITDNEINAEGRRYIYGILMSADDFEISNNKLNISSDLSYACGINIEGPVNNGVVSENNISVSAPQILYGIYTWATLADVNNVTYKYNDIYGESQSACGVESRESNSTYCYNNITMKGNYTWGIAQSMVENGIISNNNIICTSTESGMNYGDVLLQPGSMAITIKGDVLIEDNSITSNNIGINLVEAGKVIINNNIISVDAINETFNNYAIYAEIDSLKVTKNNITFKGKTDGIKNSNAVYIKGIDDVVVSDNTLNITMVSNYNSGVKFDGCNNVTFADNVVDLKYSSRIGDYDTIYVIEATESCSDVKITGNDIDAVGGTYIYGINVRATDFVVAKNNIDVKSDVKYACGVNPDAGASGIVDDNAINAVAPEVVYGIYSGMWSGFTPLTVNYTNNAIGASAFFACGIELGGAKEIVDNNTITANGNYSIGVAVYKYAQDTIETTISNNDILINANNIGNKTSTYDAVGIETAGIKITAGNTTIINNNKIESNGSGIIVKDAKADISKNNLTCDCNYDNNAILLTGVHDSSIKGNKIDAKAVSSYNSGVKFDGCDNVTFADNVVDLKYSSCIGTYDTLFVIEATDSCADVKITGNDIDAVGGSYIYGINVKATDFVVARNNIDVKSDLKYACGVNPEAGASGIVDDNAINAVAPEAAYGIYSGMWSGFTPLTVNYTNNAIGASAFFACGVELGGAKEIVDNNTITANGNYSIGVAVYKYAQDTIETTISNNDILANGNNIGDPASVYDAVGVETAGIKAMTGTLTISNNTVETTGDYAAKLGDANATVKDNYLVGKKGVGDSSIVGTGQISASGGSPLYKVILFASDLTKTEGSADQYVVTIMDENGDAVDNKTISISINGVIQNATTDKKGVAKFNIDLTAGNYLVEAKFAGDKVYGPKTITNNIVVTAKPVPTPSPSPAPVTKKSVKITAKKKTFKAKTKTKKYTITLKSGKAAVKKVKVTLKVKGKTYKATTNAKGKATFKIKNLKKKGKYTAKITFAGNANYNKATKSVKITVKK